MGSTAISAGWLRLVVLLLKLVSSPHGPSQLLRWPICSRSLPSCDHFCTMPPPVPAIQRLRSWSMKQPWMPPGMTVGSPQAFTMLPSGSYSITGGAAFLPTVVSRAVMSERLMPKT